ncbi:helix-turn-helix domain-containing protein [Aestuariivirga sp.]|uniref:helix-turn-helix domain-containing protein n=1 Tax=Aestuariivirga sp. TaxID=2650926 RepID=UPI0039E339EB
MEATSHPNLISVAAAIARLNCGRTRFYEIVNSGQLPMVKCGRRSFVRSDDLDTYISCLPPYVPVRVRATTA